MTLNLFTPTTLNGKTAYATATTVAANVLVNSAGSGTAYRINDVLVTNYSGTTIIANVAVSRSDSLYMLAGNITVPANSMMIVLGKDTPIYLEEGDALQIYANANTSVSVTSSYEFIS